jgi:chromosome partitioning protein
MFLTVSSFKGGVGKTTTAIHLAAFLARQDGAESVLLVDGDQNRSASSWCQRGSLPYKVVPVDAAFRHIPKYQHVVIDTGARPAREDLEPLVDGCDLLILPTTPEAMAVDALVQTVDLLQEIGGDRYRVLLTMVHSNPAVKMAGMAREALADLPLFEQSIRRLIAYEKASLAGVLVHQTGDRMGGVAWSEYESVGKEVLEVVNHG